jgi:hypothetical protein
MSTKVTRPKDSPTGVVRIDQEVLECLAETANLQGGTLSRMASIAVAEWLKEKHGVTLQYPRPRRGRVA